MPEVVTPTLHQIANKISQLTGGGDGSNEQEPTCGFGGELLAPGGGGNSGAGGCGVGAVGGADAANGESPGAGGDGGDDDGTVGGLEDDNDDETIVTSVG